jgi:hypothetical protein
MSAGTVAILTDVFPFFPQWLQVNARDYLDESTTLLFPVLSNSLFIHIVLPFEAV